MSVEMGIRHLETGEYEVVAVASADTFRSVWIPTAADLGLELVPLFSGGALTRVPVELVPQIISEVIILCDWAHKQPNRESLAERSSGILAAFARTDPSQCEYDFG